jgi:NADPH:quinone reductase-like Zn-dependent oxidoreductase
LAEFRDLLAMCGRSPMRPVIDSRYPLDAVAQALDRLESGGQFGKVALTIE